MSDDRTEETLDIDSTAIAAVVSESRNLQAYLIFIGGPKVGHSHLLDQPRTIVGRGSDCDVVLADPGISRSHACFRIQEEGVYVEDMDSQNGTYVNGARIDRFRYLQPGDKITIGTTILKLVYHDRLDEEFQKRLLEAATRDALTGAYNRRHLDETLRAELAYAWRHDNALCVLYYDIDKFKQINDTHGHLAGDAVLEELTRFVRESIRVEDFLARYGGDEFIILCRGLDTAEGYKLAERLRCMVEDHVFGFREKSLRLTISVGVVAIPDEALHDAETLLDAADKALYASKTAGRNQTTVGGSS